MKRLVAVAIGCVASVYGVAGSMTMDASYAPADINPDVATTNQVAEQVGNGWELGGSYGTRYLRGRASVGFYFPEDYNVSSITVTSNSDTSRISNEAGFFAFSAEAVAEYNKFRWVHASVGVGRMFLAGQRSYTMPSNTYCSNCPSNEDFDVTGGFFVRPTVSINFAGGDTPQGLGNYISLHVGYQKFLTESGLQDNLQAGITFKLLE